MTATYDPTSAVGGASVAYAEFNTDVSITGTNEAGATPIVTAPSFTPNGRDNFWLEFSCASLQPAASAGASINVVVYDNGNPIFVGTSIIATAVNPAAAQFNIPCLARLKITQPTNAAHVYSVRAFRAVANGTVNGTTGGTSRPGYINIIKEI